MSSIKMNAIFCDDLRQEYSGRFSVMGIYPRSFNISEGDGLERLGVLITLQPDNVILPKQAKIIIRGSDKRTMEWDVPLDKSASQKETGFIPVILQKIPVPDEGLTIKIFVLLEKQEYEAGELEITRS